MMNRFHLQDSPNVSPASKPLHVEQSILRISPNPSLPYTLFAPLHYEPNYSYPLIIWLHGPGDDERQLLRVMPLISMRNYASIGPRGPHRMDDGSPGFQWTAADSDVMAAEQAVFECLDIARERFNVAPQRVFLAGYQCGGTMAFRVGLRQPHRFAGILSLGGAFPTDHSPLAHLNDARKIPLFIAQGRSSEIYSVEKTCDELRLFHAAGMHVTLRQYPCGDELNTQMLHDMNVWMMEQVTGTASESDTQDVSTQYDDEV
jgi:phospholipase/carboxylesterase